MAELRVDVWSDIACPWCYVGKRRFESALQSFPHASQVKVVWHAFELDPGAPQERDSSMSHVERIARKYGMPTEQAQKATDRLIEAARGEGLAFDFEHIRSGNTFDAHRLVHLGYEKGVQGAVKERLLRGYFEEGELMSDRATLTRLGVEAGLDENDATAALASDAYSETVRADERQARELGINGVPCFVFDGRFAVSGAQPVEIMLRALEQAWSTRDPQPDDLAEGAVCGPEGC